MGIVLMSILLSQNTKINELLRSHTLYHLQVNSKLVERNHNRLYEGVNIFKKQYVSAICI